MCRLEKKIVTWSNAKKRAYIIYTIFSFLPAVKTTRSLFFFLPVEKTRRKTMYNFSFTAGHSERKKFMQCRVKENFLFVHRKKHRVGEICAQEMVHILPN